MLWLGSRLADGLAHAHDRGILHRDLKPANVLLTDDGQPMILDFNLADDRARPEGAAVGGTLPYMAPEALALFLGKPGTIDARGDLYALGVILFELLTGRHPFEVYPSASKETIARMIEERQGRPPGLRAINPRVTPAEESIVHHLLDPDPDRRYRSARDLHEDIERQLANLPLKHAPEPSVAERARKWARRHPRITSGTSIALMCGAVVLGMAALLFLRAQRMARLEAYATLAQFRDDLDTVEYLLNIQASDPKRRKEGTELAHRALGLYKAESDPAWRDGPAVAHLDEPDRARLMEDVGELALVLARALALEAADRPAGPDRAAAAEAGRRACDLAAGCFDADKLPKSLWTHRAELAALLGREDEAKDLRAKAEATPMRTPRDLHRAATDLAVAGQYRTRACRWPCGRRATTRGASGRGSSWPTATTGSTSSPRPSPATARASRFGPTSPSRGSIAGSPSAAARSRRRPRPTSTAPRVLRPDWYEPYLNRAVADIARGEPKAAIRDVDLALERGAPETRSLFIRAEARQKAGDEKGALADVEAGLRREPDDAPGWFARGMARMAKEPAAALEDFRVRAEAQPADAPGLAELRLPALRAEPRRRGARAPRPDHRPEPRLRPGAQLEGRPAGDQGGPRGGDPRGEGVALRDTTPRNVYQVAGIYATTSRQDPDDRLEAFRLLSTALRGGFGFDYLPDDHELDAIRDLPEFRELLAAARALVKAPAAR